ncbi:MAG: hypothetical protein J5685_00095 [Clostridiales bacterium]|nr:hypothetical protein [Clostridiales bacterium]
MRYVEGRFDQFVDQRKKLSGYERFELRHEFRQRGVEMLRGAWGQMRSQVQHTDDEDRYGTGLDQGLPYKTGYDQMRDDDLPERQKPTKTPLIMFIVMIIAVIGSSIFFNFAVTMAVFFGFFAVFGFYAAYKNNGRSYSHYEGATSTGSRKNGLILGFFGLAGMIPLLFSGKFGISGALILMMIAMFTAVGILLIVGFFSSLTLKQRKYTEEVCANAVAYVRTLGSSHNHSSASHHGNSGNVSIRTSPLFEYTYQGRTYQALYDRPIDGSNADIDLGPATIYIDPEHPEDVYHSSVKVGAKGIFSALICFAVAALMVVVFINNNAKPSPSEEIRKSLNARNIFTLVFGSDEEREAIAESIGENLVSSFGYEIPEEITDDLVDHYVGSFVGYENEEWYYESVHVRNVYSYDNGCSIEFDDPAFPQVSDNHDVSYWHDELLVFYVLDENEGSDGQIHISKLPLLYRNADEHTYVGTHGAYEG